MVTVRAISADEWPAFSAVGSRAFGEAQSEAFVEEHRGVVEYDRCFAALGADGGFVGTAAAYSLSLSVPGGELPAAGVTLVGVLPTHRRQGALTEMLRILHDQAAERGEPLAALWAAERPIYGRYGYGHAAPTVSLTVPTAGAGVLAAGAPDPGGHRVELLAADPTATVRLAPLYDGLRAGRGGVPARSAAWWTWYLASTPWPPEIADQPREVAVVVDADGRDAGYVMWRTKSDATDDDVPTSVAHVTEAIAATPAAAAALWTFVLGLDLVATVEIPLRPPDEPLPHLLADGRRVRRLGVDGLWVRLLDVATALAGRGYGVDGRLAIAVSDRSRPDQAGTYRLDVGADGARCTRTGDGSAADLALDVADLGAAYLGGVRFGELALAGRVVERTAGALARADAMFAAAHAPWCPRVF